MSKKTRSARGDLVDFDLLSIKQQLAATPVPVGVKDRRRFIDEKDGVKSRRTVAPVPEALALAAEAAEQSASKAKKKSAKAAE